MNISDIPRVTLINIDGKEQECTAELFEQWLSVCLCDPIKESAKTVGALCDAFRQLRNDYEYERGRAERAIALLTSTPPSSQESDI